MSKEEWQKAREGLDRISNELVLARLDVKLAEDQKALTIAQAIVVETTEAGLNNIQTQPEVYEMYLIARGIVSRAKPIEDSGHSDHFNTLLLKLIRLIDEKLESLEM